MSDVSSMGDVTDEEEDIEMPVWTEQLELLFQEADTDDNMVLTKHELKGRFNRDTDLMNMLREANKDVEQFIEDLDADGDGEITVRPNERRPPLPRRRAAPRPPAPPR